MVLIESVSGSVILAHVSRFDFELLPFLLVKFTRPQEKIQFLRDGVLKFSRVVQFSYLLSIRHH
ncbi:hypothetical protein T11_849 [Trichinella zimbabwensis]|uniref:Uncharacterized protein n=1 Tax=Trichinella zimbabwensis TaxID=268475 RepID=A0A0V1HW24_9BILA|nr:hypothetical protein T11_849 [Trichinella zimbabwensis]